MILSIQLEEAYEFSGEQYLGVKETQQSCWRKMVSGFRDRGKKQKKILQMALYQYMIKDEDRTTQGRRFCREHFSLRVPVWPDKAFTYQIPKPCS